MTDSTAPQDDAAMSPASAGSVAGEPTAWGVCWSHDVLDCEFVYEHRDNAKAVADDSNGSIVPLYRQPQPTLTDAERDAVEVAAKFMDKWGGVPNTIVSDTLRGLLERTK